MPFPCLLLSSSIFNQKPFIVRLDSRFLLIQDYFWSFLALSAFHEAMPSKHSKKNRKRQNQHKKQRQCNRSTRHRPSRRAQYQLSKLELLPLEILGLIAKQSTPSAAATLASCSHRMLYVLGTQHWKFLDEMPDEKLAFLEILEPSLPSHFILCMHCKKLHPPCHRFVDGKYYVFHGTWRRCTRANRDLPWGLGFDCFQAIMKKHRLQIDIASDLRDLTGSRWEFFNGKTEFKSIEARIVDSEILLRTQLMVATTAVRGPTPFELRIICPHQYLDLSPASRILECHVQHTKSGSHGCVRCEGLWVCQYCKTEDRIDHRQVPGLGTAFVITAWLDLGSCRRETDGKWQRYTEQRLALLPSGDRENKQLLATGAIQKRFGPVASPVDQEAPLGVAGRKVLKSRRRV